ncbi:MAG TPA: CDP-diacylglycerol diphosphatase, partial [Roseiarcus sp.]|nr:CDP-diacylglycerol diphosphatase [Roseiarcus sp.]
TVQACRTDFKLIGSPFPCLRVDLTGGEQRGYVVLKSPFGPSDTILAPTRRVTGIEDPWLLLPDAPDYFDAAWRARALVKGAGGAPLGRDNAALAVNSALTRSQDQFHIHIGCLAAPFRRWLPELVARLPSGEWARLDVAMAGSSFRALRLGRTDLGGVEPVRLAAQELSGKAQGLARLSILVAEIRIAGADELVLFASSASGSLGAGSAEDMIDPGCSGGS